MPHGRHIYVTSSDMSMATRLSHWKGVLRCCSDCPRIDLPDQESDRHYYNAYPSISFHVYHLIARCTFYGICPLDKNTFCQLCFQDPATVTPTKLYTIKELVMMETYIAGFHTSFYIPAIKNLTFHLPHVRILGTNHCGNHAVKH